MAKMRLKNETMWLLMSLVCLLATCCLPLIAQTNTAKPKPKVEETKAASIWTDAATGLTWTNKDSDSELDWNGAKSYCQNLSLGGYSDWRLPIVDELRGIYDRRATATTVMFNSYYKYHIKGGIVLKGQAGPWSATEEGSGEAWLFSFLDGGPYSSRKFPGMVTYALCVRGSRKK
jgi:hypothetical protein